MNANTAAPVLPITDATADLPATPGQRQIIAALVAARNLTPRVADMVDSARRWEAEGMLNRRTANRLIREIHAL